LNSATFALVVLILALPGVALAQATPQLPAAC
jgi:hypothetical protein